MPTDTTGTAYEIRGTIGTNYGTPTTQSSTLPLSFVFPTKLKLGDVLKVQVRMMYTDVAKQLWSPEDVVQVAAPPSQPQIDDVMFVALSKAKTNDGLVDLPDKADLLIRIEVPSLNGATPSAALVEYSLEGFIDTNGDGVKDSGEVGGEWSSCPYDEDTGASCWGVSGVVASTVVRVYESDQTQIKVTGEGVVIGIISSFPANKKARLRVQILATKKGKLDGGAAGNVDIHSSYGPERYFIATKPTSVMSVSAEFDKAEPNAVVFSTKVGWIAGEPLSGNAPVTGHVIHWRLVKTIFVESRTQRKK